MKQGTKANKTGRKLEQFITHTLEDLGYKHVDKKDFEKSRILGQPIYTRQLYICKSIYNTEIHCDFIIYHPDKHPDCLAIESKWQQSSGSVDEKFPYLVHNIKEMYPCKAIIIIDGGGYKPAAEIWLRKQIDQKLLKVFSMAEFQKWSNSDAI
ncbi:MAG TPA: hypothetical protein PKB02_10480 [Anaerohalosphaeraceae bacterium]|nr:hypothetical protein [Anaerohalosphaeraceae bacterium]